MVRLVLLGLAASAFFSATFILNRSMSLGGGHWFWSASLRYLYMIGILACWITVRHGPGRLKSLFRLFASHLLFWCVAGGIGFGVFYAALCFAADHAPGWVIAATWQATILATPVVLAAFGRRVPVRGVLFAVAIFLGIALVNAEHVQRGLGLREALLGVLPVLVAALAYPTGNQMLNTACHGGRGRIPALRSRLLEDAPSCVFLMTLGSVPFWIVLALFVLPPAPGSSQWLQTGLVALSSGVIATSLFYHARNATHAPMAIAAVDATQAGEVVFSLLGEIVFLAGAWPDLLGGLGLVLIVAGLVGYCLSGRQASSPTAGKRPGGNSHRGSLRQKDTDRNLENNRRGD